MNPLQHIQLHKLEFTKSELMIMEYITKHFDVISSYPIGTVASECKVSKSALLRFCQKCGYTGYSEFKYEISRYLQSVVNVKDIPSNTTQHLVSLYAKQISSLPDYLHEKEMDHFSLLITKARKIRIYGVHETGLSAQYFVYRLATLGIDSEVVLGNYEEKASFSTKLDLDIFLSLSAETSSIQNAIVANYENHANSILITQNDHHKFKQMIGLSIVLPTFHYEKEQIFLDSQALLFVTIDLIINHLAKHLANAS